MTLPPVRWHDPATLHHLEQLRRPVDAVNRRIVRSVLDRTLPRLPAGKPLVEIGSGGGQLFDWLPDRLRPCFIATEPSPVFLDHHRSRHPHAVAIQADATALPFGDGSVAAVLGLCVLDSLAEPEKVRDELRRVLVPGGLVIHFLDLSVNPEGLAAEIVGRGETPLPNCFGGECLTSEDDLLVVKQSELERVLTFLAETGHPAHQVLAPYARSFQRTSDPYPAGQGLMRLTSRREELSRFKALLRDVLMTFPGEPLSLVPFSSHHWFRERLHTLFRPETGFTVEQADVISATETRPRDDTLPADRASFTRIVGKTSVTAGNGESVRVTSGIDVFVARRQG